MPAAPPARRAAHGSRARRARRVAAFLLPACARVVAASRAARRDGSARGVQPLRAHAGDVSLRRAAERGDRAVAREQRAHVAGDSKHAGLALPQLSRECGEAAVVADASGVETARDRLADLAAFYELRRECGAHPGQGAVLPHGRGGRAARLRALAASGRAVPLFGAASAADRSC
ncbi:Carotenoid cleavage dioxygenase 7 [Gracilaria domingensis]|nr:Carotenoid cleavage dioxygenase 7 [Gracilaria domingensis]